MRLDGKASVSLGVVLGVCHGSVLELFLLILCTSKLFLEKYMACYAYDTVICAIIPRSLSRRQVMTSLNQDLAGINSWCLNWHMTLIPKTSKSVVVSWFWSYAPSYGDLTLGLRSLRR